MNALVQEKQRIAELQRQTELKRIAIEEEAKRREEEEQASRLRAE